MIAVTKYSIAENIPASWQGIDFRPPRYKNNALTSESPLSQRFDSLMQLKAIDYILETMRNLISVDM